MRIHPAVVLDMSDAQPGERTFTIGDRNVKLLRGVHLVRAIPVRSAVSVRAEADAHRAGPRALPQRRAERLRWSRSARVDPPDLEITGPRSHVARVAAVIADPVDLANTTGTSTFHVNVFTEDSFVRFQDAPEAVVTVTMKKKS